MKLNYIFFKFIFLFMSISSIGIGEYMMPEEDYQKGDDGYLMEDYSFYPQPSIWINGHMWRIILVTHHPDCTCHENDYDVK